MDIDITKHVFALNEKNAIPLNIIYVKKDKYDTVVSFNDPLKRNSLIKKTVNFDEEYDVSPWCNSLIGSSKYVIRI
ncbi:793_t:CDS:2 [Cetraspora pellucida]|uniref:793_t:CDS:1 n=1 Tax=Cetraspora pellucida TaxID=1433469 RepID=A0ACA9KB77_9GLOM|nr:793_t:CDS:2 [Cetraspora pellucida]